ncbi:NAD-P-binding protein [Auriscalpium vulgare]|uniref:NAD-P-binding protein n=1 Tax=Auriscalpium vulgare TaxID=40419 RepID=A0ACB8RLK1_9AGAM|nr:NAD-P-binding protein [Auriscalpium vulgare]
MADAVLNPLSASNIFDVRGVVAVVTGGGSGIGLMIATTLVANGATVYIIGLEQSELDSIAKVYNDAAEGNVRWGRMHGVQGDISQKSEAKRLAEEIGRREKHVTILFNNAGIVTGSFVKPKAATADAFVEAYFHPITPKQFTDTFNVNAVGPYWLTFAFLPLLEKWKESELAHKFVAQVVMTSSVNGWTKDPLTAGNSFPYIYSKSAIGHATATLAHELLPLGIRVNSIAPGFFSTQMSSPNEPADEFGRSRLVSASDFGLEIPASSTGGTSRDMGSLVLMLVANWYINGETVLIDGGMLLKYPSSY